VDDVVFAAIQGIELEHRGSEFFQVGVDLLGSQRAARTGPQMDGTQVGSNLRHLGRIGRGGAAEDINDAALVHEPARKL
jgi:hypothetical protein